MDCAQFGGERGLKAAQSEAKCAQDRNLTGDLKGKNPNQTAHRKFQIASRMCVNLIKLMKTLCCLIQLISHEKKTGKEIWLHLDEYIKT